MSTEVERACEGPASLMVAPTSPDSPDEEEEEEVVVRRRRRRRRRVMLATLLALPIDAFAWVLGCLDASALVSLRASCGAACEACEAWAAQLVKSRGWRMADGVRTAVERLATTVCVFEPASFRDIGTNGTGRTLCFQTPKGPFVDRVMAIARAMGSNRVQSDRTGAICMVRDGAVAATFSEFASAVTISAPGRYRLAGLVEPSLLASSARVGGHKRRRPPPEEGARRKRRKLGDLAFEVRVAESGPPKSSIYVGVAGRAWATTDEVGQAVRSDQAWLLDLRRGRFVHDYPNYDRRVATVHGPDRARLYATTDDVIRNGDTLGVRVRGDMVEFYKNGSRLAFAAGGAAHPVPLPELQDDDEGGGDDPGAAGLDGDDDDDGAARPVAPPRRDGRRSTGDRHFGWGRPIPRDADLVPIVEVHARLDDETAPARRSPYAIIHPRSPASKLALELSAWDPRADVGRPPRARVLGADDDQFLSPRVARGLLMASALNFAPHLPVVVGVLQLAIEIYGATGSTRAPRRRNSADALALSMAVSAIWKCHFYDRRRPRRSRRGLRAILKAHFYKCIVVATAVGLLTPARVPGPVSRALVAYGLWLACEFASELLFHRAARRGSRLAADLRNFPSDAGRHRNNNTIALHTVLKFVAFFCVVPGSASVLVAVAANHFSFSPDATPPSPVLPRTTRYYLVPAPSSSSSTRSRPASLFLESSSTSTTTTNNLVADLGSWAPPHLVRLLDDALATRTLDLTVFAAMDDHLSSHMLAATTKTTSVLLACHSSRCWTALDAADVPYQVTPFALEPAEGDESNALRIALLGYRRHDVLDVSAMSLTIRACVYLVFGSWIFVTLFVKIVLLMFGVQALCGFEDFDVPGWLLDASPRPPP